MGRGYIARRSNPSLGTSIRMTIFANNEYCNKSLMKLSYPFVLWKFMTIYIKRMAFDWTTSLTANYCVSLLVSNLISYMDSNHFLRDFSDNIGLFHLINF